jgi:hypothetical protein
MLVIVVVVVAVVMGGVWFFFYEIGGVYIMVSYIYSTFCPDTAFVARTIHQMTRMINYQNQD